MSDSGIVKDKRANPQEPALLPEAKKSNVVFIPNTLPETSEQEKIIQLGGFSLKSLLTPTLPLLNAIEKKALENVRKLLPLVAGKDEMLNINDIPELVKVLLSDPEVLQEVQTGIAAEVGNKKDQIHSKQPLRGAEKFPLLGKVVKKTVDTIVDAHVAKNQGKYNEQGIAVAKEKIEEQLHLLFKIHGAMPQSLEPDTSSRAGVTKKMIEELGVSLKILYNYELRTRQSFEKFGTTKQDERFAEGISLKLFAALNDGKPTVSEYSKEVKEAMRAFNVGHVPMESSLRYATDNELSALGVSAREGNLFYYDQSKGYVIRKEKGAKPGDLSAFSIKQVDGWGVFDDRVSNRMYLADAELLDLRHSGGVQTKLTETDPKTNPLPASFEGQQRAANLQVQERYNAWVNSRVTKIDLSKKENFKKFDIAEDPCNQSYDFYSFGEKETGGPKVVAISKDGNCFFVKRTNKVSYPGHEIEIFEAVSVGGETGGSSVALSPAEIGLIQKLRCAQ